MFVSFGARVDLDEGLGEGLPQKSHNSLLKQVEDVEINPWAESETTDLFDSQSSVILLRNFFTTCTHGFRHHHHLPRDPLFHRNPDGTSRGSDDTAGRGGPGGG